MTRIGDRSTDTIPWTDLVRRCASGDERAWASLVESAWPMVYRWMQRTCHDVDLAEDLAQTVFLRLLEQRGRRLLAYDPDRGTSFPSYLKAIASNLLVDWSRSREGLDRTRWFDLEAAGDLVGFTPSTDERRHVTWILDCVDRLAPREAQALRLLLCGWSYEEIARDLAIGSGGAGALIHRGREHLRQILDRPLACHPGLGSPTPTAGRPQAARDVSGPLALD